jgi:hypothetical protein
MYENVPTQPVVIQKVTVLSASKPAAKKQH